MIYVLSPEEVAVWEKGQKTRGYERLKALLPLLLPLPELAPLFEGGWLRDADLIAGYREMHEQDSAHALLEVYRAFLHEMFFMTLEERWAWWSSEAR